MFKAIKLRKAMLQVPKRFKGNFEQHHTIPPRYFLLTLRLDENEFEKKIDGSATHRSPIVTEHTDKV